MSRSAGKALEKIQADTEIRGRWIAPVEPPGALREDHALILRQGRILDLLPAAEAGRRYRAQRRLRLDRHLLLPGLVNSHCHAAMTLLRGLADDLPLMPWLQEHIWPAERRWVGPDFVRDGSRLALAEMIRGGTTCCNDMYFFPEIAAGEAERAGMRMVAGLPVLAVPTPWASGEEECLAKAATLRRLLSGRPLVAAALAPHAPYTVSDDGLRRVRELAAEWGLRIHMHVHETATEVADSVRQHGCRPLERLRKLGLLGPELLAVHLTQLHEEEIGQLAQYGAHAVHCPESNLKLASGACPAARLLRAGANVALGTDGAASNNDLDLIGEMRSAALLGKFAAADSSALRAREVLRMATLGGAQALGLAERIGSLVPGKEADIVAVDLDCPETQPVYDPVAQLVYAACRSQVSDVWVAGRQLLAGRELTTLDAAAAIAAARDWRRRIGGGD